jgi:hypothetical protein
MLHNYIISIIAENGSAVPAYDMLVPVSSIAKEDVSFSGANSIIEIPNDISKTKYYVAETIAEIQELSNTDYTPPP